MTQFYKSGYRITLLVQGLLFIMLFSQSMDVKAQQPVKYSTSWFGPNALPVPEFGDATLPENTTVILTGDYYFGHGDRTQNEYLKVKIPLLPRYISFNLWAPFFEFYHTDLELAKKRNVKDNATHGSYIMGDLYVQTQINILKERQGRPALVLNATLKTASGNRMDDKRSFDTPGYYFDLETGKSFYLSNGFLREIRLVANLGFLSWETTNSAQDDAPILGAKLLLRGASWELENSFSSYIGWRDHIFADYGDRPVVYRLKLTKNFGGIQIFGQYQRGLHDFPYDQIRLGLQFEIKKLTPRFGN